ncbi:Short-chain dehydrogenase/reductase SDR [Sphingobium herbicidovorans NBRC 16415]|uniref:Short-chain dehydrogenase/reductase SDR n=1 Tax=Sphingobium herbicidovorans (strain ATCC 700291 / DSM 11019 / CCUG 56400 / KCTC 2939 / LMG 18315 / NBRC 16415 / MH) TaxID=1219045 RepID=A0A086PBZ0_SPHHM|nr:SDR family oxidoreductase [Sphingobium herbicidovorans]KFG90908.1 Short-chain dehydrogenase/reductase SDR [Sphingobium herbicidovorans NBRC 16415]
MAAKRKTALVVGGSGVLGQAICLKLASHGMDVAFTYHSNQAVAANLIARLEALEAAAVAERIALTDPAAVTEFIDGIAARFGALDSFVYAAGPSFDYDLIAKIEPAEWARVMQQDLIGGFNAIHAALPRIREARGTIVAVLTAGVSRSPPRDILSVAPKAGLQALVRGIAVEEGRNGVRANCVAPGFVGGGLGKMILDKIGEERARAIIEAIPMKRRGTADEMATAVHYLSSDQSSYVTGNTLYVSGGLEL